MACFVCLDLVSMFNVLCLMFCAWILRFGFYGYCFGLLGVGGTCL